MIGGLINLTKSNSCEYYHIGNANWQEAPELNEARSSNSSCSLGDYIYTFGGYGNKGSLKSVERLNAKSLLECNTEVAWTLIEPLCQAFTPRCNIAVTPISETKIILIGGYDYETKKANSETYLFDIGSI